MKQLAEIDLVVRLKPDVRLTKIYVPIYYGLLVVNRVYKKVLGRDATPIITSWEDGKHGKNSLHLISLALDLRSRYYPANKQNELARRLTEELRKHDPHWDVVLEHDKFREDGKQYHWGHIHIEYDLNKEVCDG